jgi:hypothetical protein
VPQKKAPRGIAANATDDERVTATTGASRHRRAWTDAGVHRRLLADAPPLPVDAAPPAPAPAPDGNSQPTLEFLSRTFHNGDYATVVRICSAALVRPEIANVCSMAACQDNNPWQVKRWLPAANPARRELLATYCKEHGGIDIGKPLDCSKDAPDCR